MSYRLSSVTDLPASDSALLTLVHPNSAVDIVRDILSRYISTRDPIDNMDPAQRADELLEQLARGEQVLFDASGSSYGIFRGRQATPDSLATNLPPALIQAIEAHWEGSARRGVSAVPLKSDSLAPAIEPAYQPSSSPAASSEPKVGSQVIELLYRWPDGSPVAGAEYQVEGLDDFITGTLDANGYAKVSGLNDPSVKVRFGKPAPAGELDILRRQLQAGMDGILARERREAAKLDASTEDLPLSFKAGVHFAQGFMGLWDSATGLIANNLAMANLSHVGHLSRAVQAAWNATVNGSDQAWMDTFNQQFDESNKRALVEVLGFDPDAISREQLAEAYEVTALILSDPESRDMLGQFAVDFAQAQDSTELSYMAGGLAFETVLAIFLGAAVGAKAASAAPRYLKKLAPLADALRKLAARLKISYQTRYHYGVDTGTLCESTCRPRPEGPELQVRSLESRRLRVNSLKEAKAALKASRKRLIRRGGFTPKYTQEELTLLTSKGLDDDRFIVRLVEAHHVDGYQQPQGAMEGTFGRPNPDNGQVRFWSTTLDQIEPSDTCPKLIAQQMGFYPATADIPKKRHTVPKECSCPDAENIAQSSNAKPLL
ncbi:hypothetical protein [uncultured Marinobacter sp.]|uniref:hypothetical protein n=1 Tax=uncultured Marinobacter sp. TaxID=187379 RepID=UPI00258C9DF9|nr:hypothetical protein [uncultured Marinobacter sp.]